MSLVDKGGYLFDTDRAKYIFALPCMPREPFVVDKVDIDSLCAAYSKHGENATKHECAVELGWDEIVVEQVLKAMNFRHSNLPYSEEDLGGRDEDDLAEDMLRIKERKVKRKSQALHWKKIKDSAAKWERFEENARRIHQALNTQAAEPVEKSPLALSLHNFDKLALFTHATDLHYGKAGWLYTTGKEQNRESTEADLIETTNKLIDSTLRFGMPDTIFVGVGGDWVHIDGSHGNTAAGTPQDHDGSFFQIWTGAYRLARKQIEMYRPVCKKVVVVPVRGNHDRDAVAHLLFTLQEVYADCDDVEVLNPFAHHQFIHWENHYLMVTHGEIPYARMRQMMAAEHADIWGRTEHRTIFTGHLHSQSQDEDFGVTIERFSSLASADDWHRRKGYIRNVRALQGVLLSKEGTLAKLTARASHQR